MAALMGTIRRLNSLVVIFVWRMCNCVTVPKAVWLKEGEILDILFCCNFPELPGHLGDLERANFKALTYCPE